MLGPYFTLAAGRAPAPPDPTNPPTVPYELRVIVSGTSPCGGGGWIGCGGPDEFAVLDGQQAWTAGTVWLHPDLDEYSTGVQQSVLIHELGHALNLGHYDRLYEGNVQVMRSFVDAGSPVTQYRSGDRNGLRATRGRPPSNDPKSGAVRISLADPVKRARTWFARADSGDPELTSRFSNASRRSVWFKYNATAADVGRELVVETGNDGVDDFDTLLGRVVGSTLVDSNDDSGGTRLSRIRFTPGNTSTTHFFVVDGKSRKRGITHLSIRPAGDRLRALRPARIVDSTTGVGGFTSRWGDGTSRAVTVKGRGGVPGTATAVVATVTAVAPSAYGTLFVHPDGTPRPNLASVSFRRDQSISNQVIVPLRGTPRMRIFNSNGSTHVRVDVYGYFTGGSGAKFQPLTPRRMFDSTNGTNTPRDPWGANSSRTIRIAGRSSVPADASAVMLNLTARGAESKGTAVVWPAGTSRPSTTALTWQSGEPTGAQVLAKLGEGGAIVVRSSSTGRVNFVADVVGWFGADGSTTYVPLPKRRAFDTRDGYGGIGDYNMSPGQTRTANLTVAEVPGAARAVELNVRIFPQYAAGTAFVWSGAGARPGVANVHWGLDFSDTGRPSPVHALTTGTSNGRIAIHNRVGYPQALGDVDGYYAP